MIRVLFVHERHAEGTKKMLETLDERLREMEMKHYKTVTP